MSEKVTVKVERNVLHLPAIALRGLVVFPNNLLHFEVGRDKSIAAVEWAVSNNSDVFLIAQKEMKVEDPNVADLCTYGVVAEIKQVMRVSDKVVRHPHHLLDLGYNAVSAQVGDIGVFHFHLFLRNEEDIGVIAHGPFHSRNALVAAHLKVKQVVGEDHKPPQGNGRKMEDIALHLDSYFFRHIAKPPNCPGRCASS